MKIHKYQFPDCIYNNVYEFELPKSSKILDIQIQHGAATLWYTRPDQETETFTCRIGFYVTGFDTIPNNARYIRTLQFQDGWYILHAFEL